MRSTVTEVRPTMSDPEEMAAQGVQRADERLDAGGENHAPTGSNEERIAEEVTQLRQ
jgi:hypothetical protein